MSQTPSCPKCGAPLADDAPAGLCPKCLVQAGFESENQSRPEPAVTTPNPTSSGFTPPAVEDLARRFPQLEILELLGKGGMGAVYKARQPGLDRLVAVKILPVETSHDPTFAERFTREARALARLSHPNIVAIYDFGQTEGLYFFVMEYVDGVNLRQAIQAGGMTPQTALTIVPQICDALQFAHDEGIVHRDIKPENILIDKRGRVKIADFGLAKLLGLEQADHALTHTRQVMGTLRYMAPEQMEGSHEVDHRADIYSLGVVFYELLTGELPIGRFAPPSKKVQIDVRLDEVVLRALETEPEQRYQHASELKTSVDQIAATPSIPAGHAPLSRTTDLPPTAPDARLPRSALFGAIWASYFFVALIVLIPMFLVLGSSQTAEPMRAAMPARALQIADSGDPAMFDGLIAQAVVDSPGGSRELFKLLLLIAAAVAGLIAVAAPFGTTILGFVAIGQIRRSAGKLYGLPLAEFDALLFPLLLLDFLIMVVVAAVVMMVLMLCGGPRGPQGELMSALPTALTLLISLPIIAWADYRIARAAWRMIAGVQPPSQPAVATAIPGGGV
jgi:predicted Ser/Thr protein kinase